MPRGGFGLGVAFQPLASAPRFSSKGRLESRNVFRQLIGAPFARREMEVTMRTKLYISLAYIFVSALVISPELASARKITTGMQFPASRSEIEKYCAFQGGLADGTKGTGVYGCSGGKSHPNCAINCTPRGVCSRTCVTE
jgi:hypothetical protein